MDNNIKVTIEPIDDIPVLLAQARKINIPKLLDRHFPQHGNWKVTSFGWTLVIWLTHILSEGDHRLNQVEQWVEKLLQTLSICMGQNIQPRDWSDDRLGIALDELADTQKWQAFETDLNRHSIRVYDLTAKRVRVDSTTASGYWTVTEDGLFQFGHSKDHRPDLPQLKVNLSALDPLGMPLVTQVVSGERADDGLYIPAVQQLNTSLEKPGLLYVGDCKMAALETRTLVQDNGDYYLCPLSAVQMPQEDLEKYLQPVWQGTQTTTPIYRENVAGEVEHIAEGYEQTVRLSSEIDGKVVTWTERRLIVRSLQYAQSGEANLQERLRKAQADVLQLNEPKQGKKLFPDRESLQDAAQKILQRYRVAGLLKLNMVEISQERQVRAYGKRPARIEIERTLTIQPSRDTEAVKKAKGWLGWRVYATNQPKDTLPLEQALLAYREEYLVERGFGRLKGKPLSLSPMYLQSDQRATGLIRLLSIGLRILTLIEYQARKRLAERREKLPGLYAGNPKRSTDRPTAEALLRAFKNIYLVLDKQIYYHMTPLTEIQEKILGLLDLPVEIYTQIARAFLKSPGKMTEP
jgi:transposase